MRKKGSYNQTIPMYCHRHEILCIACCVRKKVQIKGDHKFHIKFNKIIDSKDD